MTDREAEMRLRLDKPPALAELQDIAAELMQAELDVARLRARMHAMIVRLHQAGVRPIRLAEAAGVTRQRVNQLLVAAREKTRMARDA